MKAHTIQEAANWAQHPLVERAKLYLERYLMLIAFSAFLLQTNGHKGASFTAWWASSCPFLLRLQPQVQRTARNSGLIAQVVSDVVPV